MGPAYWHEDWRRCFNKMQQVVTAAGSEKKLKPFAFRQAWRRAYFQWRTVWRTFQPDSYFFELPAERAVRRPIRRLNAARPELWLGNESDSTGTKSTAVHK